MICNKCGIKSDDVHECMNCDVNLCIDCDENEMPIGADDHTYCTPCVKMLFVDSDYEDESNTKQIVNNRGSFELGGRL